MNAARRPLIIGTYTTNQRQPDGRPSGMLTASYDETGVAGAVTLALSIAWLYG